MISLRLVVSLWHSSRRFATQTTLLGSSQHFGRRSSSEVQFEHPAQLASFLAASSPHSRDWLQAVPISSYGFRLDDEAVRIGVGLRLDLTLCVPHKCHCGALVDAQGLHGFVCKKALGRPARHHALNDLVTRAMVSAGIPCTEEPLGLSQSDVKRPDGLSLVPWEAGKPLTWDVWYGMVNVSLFIVLLSQKSLMRSTR